MTPVLAAAFVATAGLATLLGLGVGMRVGRLRALPSVGSVLDALPPPDDDRWKAETMPCPGCNGYYRTTYILGDVRVCTYAGHVSVDNTKIAGGQSFGRRILIAQQRRRALESWT